jgi:starvation-inducible DNA-binding protein
MQKTEKPDTKSPKRLNDLATPTDLKPEAVKEIAAKLNVLVADAFALYLKTKNFHWHISGPHFRDYHLLLDEQSDQIFASIDPLAERVRKIGATTLRSLSHASELTGIEESNDEFVDPHDMLHQLMNDNKKMAHSLREAHSVCDEHEDVASASLIENFLDETERRVWFLFEAGRRI